MFGASVTGANIWVLKPCHVVATLVASAQLCLLVYSFKFKRINAYACVSNF